jgi:pectin methylesterase-like acyl-CoA thioesterase
VRHELAHLIRARAGAAVIGAVALIAAPAAALAAPEAPALASAAGPVNVTGHRVFVVAKDGKSGHYASVQAAIDAVPPGDRGRVTILIEKGTYWGQVYVPASKPGITLLGATGDPRDVTITDDIAHGTIAANGNQYGTDCSATMSVAGNGFSAYGVTVQNSFDPTANPQITSPQAVAVKTVADRVVFAHDRFLGIQDTVFASSYADPFTPAECFAPGGPPATSPPGAVAPPAARQLYYDDYIDGSVDFLCGSADAVFDRDTIDILGHPGGSVTAPDTGLEQPYGYLIINSRIVNSNGTLAAGSNFLGRPWQHTGVTRPVGQITIRNTYLTAAINAQHWENWSSPPFPWQDARFYEDQNSGPGAADVAADVPQLTAAQAAQYTVASYLGGWRPWHPGAG